MKANTFDDLYEVDFGKIAGSIKNGIANAASNFGANVGVGLTSIYDRGEAEIKDLARRMVQDWNYFCQQHSINSRKPTAEAIVAFFHERLGMTKFAQAVAAEYGLKGPADDDDVDDDDDGEGHGEEGTPRSLIRDEIKDTVEELQATDGSPKFAVQKVKQLIDLAKREKGENKEDIVKFLRWLRGNQYYMKRYPDLDHMLPENHQRLVGLALALVEAENLTREGVRSKIRAIYEDQLVPLDDLKKIFGKAAKEIMIRHRNNHGAGAYNADRDERKAAARDAAQTNRQTRYGNSGNNAETRGSSSSFQRSVMVDVQKVAQELSEKCGYSISMWADIVYDVQNGETAEAVLHRIPPMNSNEYRAAIAILLQVAGGNL